MRRALPILAALAVCACATEPATPAGDGGLVGPEWRLEDLLGGGIIDRSHLTLQLSAEGQAAGSAGCNRYFGAWSGGTGGKLGLGKMGSTRKACAPSLMEQESRFLRSLETASAYSFTGDGALVVTTAEGPLTFRKD